MHTMHTPVHGRHDINDGGELRRLVSSGKDFHSHIKECHVSVKQTWISCKFQSTIQKKHNSHGKNKEEKVIDCTKCFIRNTEQEK